MCAVDTRRERTPNPPGQSKRMAESVPKIWNRERNVVETAVCARLLPLPAPAAGFDSRKEAARSLDVVSGRSLRKKRRSCKTNGPARASKLRILPGQLTEDATGHHVVGNRKTAV